MILTLEAKCALAVDVIKNSLICPLFNICSLSHNNNALDVVEPIEKLLLYLLSIVNGLRMQVSVPVEFKIGWTISPITYCQCCHYCTSRWDVQHIILGYLSYRIGWTWESRTLSYTKSINPLRVVSGIEITVLQVSPKLSFNNISNQLLDLFSSHWT